jgi:hypothetical protein
MRALIVAVCGFLTAALALSAPAGSAGRQIMIFNYGDEPIFWVSVGHAQTAVWSGDVLGSSQVIDVGAGEIVSLPVAGQCVYDVRARYHDGDTADLAAVDLCSVSSIRFDH